jgi:hypothetical protein
LVPPGGCLLQTSFGTWISAGEPTDCGTSNTTPCYCWVCDEGTWKKAGDGTSQVGQLVGGVCSCTQPTDPC